MSKLQFTATSYLSEISTKSQDYFVTELTLSWPAPDILIH